MSKLLEIHFNGEIVVFEGNSDYEVMDMASDYLINEVSKLDWRNEQEGIGAE